MFKTFKEIREMPYHIKKKVMDRLYSVLMYAILIITLFPILWMFYCSFKGNDEILDGRVPLDRAHYNVLRTKEDGNYLWILTSDGSLNKVDKKTKKIKLRKRFKTIHTNFVFGDKYIWLSSADKGLQRINKNDFSDIKSVDLDWGQTLDFSKISKTHLAVDEQKGKVWISIGYRDLAKVLEFNTDTLVVSKVYDLKSFFGFAFEKISVSNLLVAKDSMYVATNRGLIEVDLVSREPVKGYQREEFSAQEIRHSFYDKNADKVYFASMSRLYTLNNTAGGAKIRAIFTTITDEGFEQIVCVRGDINNLYLGTGHGVMVLSKGGKLRKEINAPLFDDVDKKGNLIEKGRYVSSVVSDIQIVNDRFVYLGTSAGRVTYYDITNEEIYDTYLVDKKGFILLRWRNYVDLWRNINFGLYLGNSFIICGMTALISMILATITAYALVRFDFPGSKFISTAILSTQMIPGIMLLIPIYIMFVKITQITGLPIKGTYGGMIFVYSAFFLPFSIWILRGFFASIPIALEEAATIDGCTPFQVFKYIAIPLAIPGIVATGIFVFLVAWDELMMAWILTNEQTMTIPVGIRLFVGNFQNRFDLMMAAATVATLPVIIVFILLQKYIVSGLTAGAVKG